MSDDLYLFLGNRHLHCKNYAMESDGNLGNCILSVDVEVDGPVRYAGKVAVGCKALFKLHFLRAYHPIMDTESRQVTVGVKNGIGKATVDIPVRRTDRLRSIASNKLLKVHVDKLTCRINSKH